MSCGFQDCGNEACRPCWWGRLPRAIQRLRLRGLAFGFAHPDHTAGHLGALLRGALGVHGSRASRARVQMIEGDGEQAFRRVPRREPLRRGVGLDGGGQLRGEATEDNRGHLDRHREPARAVAQAVLMGVGVRLAVGARREGDERLGVTLCHVAAILRQCARAVDDDDVAGFGGGGVVGHDVPALCPLGLASDGHYDHR